MLENKHPYVTKGEADSKVVRQGNKVHVYMTSIRSHFAPDNIEGIKVGDESILPRDQLRTRLGCTAWFRYQRQSECRIIDYAR